MVIIEFMPHCPVASKFYLLHQERKIQIYITLKLCKKRANLSILHYICYYSRLTIYMCYMAKQTMEFM